MTHGDMLSLEDRARVRVFLGELLGIPPAKQIFDIPGDKTISSTFFRWLYFFLVIEMNCICFYRKPGHSHRANNLQLAML